MWYLSRNYSHTQMQVFFLEDNHRISISKFLWSTTQSFAARENTTLVCSSQARALGGRLAAHNRRSRRGWAWSRVDSLPAPRVAATFRGRVVESAGVAPCLESPTSCRTAPHVEPVRCFVGSLPPLPSCRFLAVAWLDPRFRAARRLPRWALPARRRRTPTGSAPRRRAADTSRRGWSRPWRVGRCSRRRGALRGTCSASSSRPRSSSPRPR